MKNLNLRGVPSSLRQDGWWLDSYTPARPAPKRPRAAQTSWRHGIRIGLLASLIALAQLPEIRHPADPPAQEMHALCDEGPDLGFHAADALRSLGADWQQGEAQAAWPIS